MDLGIPFLLVGSEASVCEGLDPRGGDPEELSTGDPRVQTPHSAAVFPPHPLAALPEIYGEVNDY